MTKAEVLRGMGSGRKWGLAPFGKPKAPEDREGENPSLEHSAGRVVAQRAEGRGGHPAGPGAPRQLWAPWHQLQPAVKRGSGAKPAATTKPINSLPRGMEVI